MRRPDELSKADAQKVVAGIAGNTGNIYYTTHAQKQMRLRNLTTSHVVKTLRRGAVIEGPYLSIHDDWKMNFRYVTAGTKVVVTVAIGWPSELIIVTAMD